MLCPLVFQDFRVYSQTLLSKTLFTQTRCFLSISCSPTLIIVDSHSFPMVFEHHTYTHTHTHTHTHTLSEECVTHTSTSKSRRSHAVRALLFSSSNCPHSTVGGFFPIPAPKLQETSKQVFTFQVFSIHRHKTRSCGFGGVSPGVSSAVLCTNDRQRQLSNISVLPRPANRNRARKFQFFSPEPGPSTQKSMDALTLHTHRSY